MPKPDKYIILKAEKIFNLIVCAQRMMYVGRFNRNQEIIRF